MKQTEVFHKKMENRKKIDGDKLNFKHMDILGLLPLGQDTFFLIKQFWQGNLSYTGLIKVNGPEVDFYKVDTLDRFQVDSRDQMPLVYGATSPMGNYFLTYLDPARPANPPTPSRSITQKARNSTKPN